MEKKAVRVDNSDVFTPMGKNEISEYLNNHKRFSAFNKMILRDLNNNRNTPSFFLYSKDEITQYLSDPYTYQQQLRNAVIYMYTASSHFRRIIKYFVGLTDFAYVVSPYNIDIEKANDTKKVKKNYLKTLHILDSFNIKNTFNDILTVCFREDTFYGTIRASSDNIMIQQLPSEYCDICSVEEGVINVSFNFSYFDSNQALLNMYPEEFTTKYNLYRNDRVNSKWQELNSPDSFAIKCNKDILSYPVPPFIGVLRELYEIEDYKQLNMTQTELENYALLVMKLEREKGNYMMPYEDAKDFWMNLDGVLPEEVGSVLSPMPIEKISLGNNNTSDVDTVRDSEEHLFTSAGVSSLLFNNEKASSNALLLSIKADQAITFELVKSIENMLNRYLHSISASKYFKISFLDTSIFNRNEASSEYLKGCQYGLPFVSYYCAAQGLTQSDINNMHYFENEIMGIPEKFVPLKSSATQSGDVGAPAKNIEDLSDSGETTRERDED